MSFCYFKKQNSQSSDSVSIYSEDKISASNTNSGTSSSLSSNSCVWTLQSKQQNLEDWEHIERIFYGESELPGDVKTREEFVEWMTAFPHLRVVGKKIDIPAVKSTKTNFEHVDEIIAIDPPLESLMPSFTVLDHELNRATFRKSNNYSHESLKNNDISKYLRITSGSIQRSQNKNIIDRNIVAKSGNITTKKTSRPSEIQRQKDYNQSFQYSDIPKILNIKFLLNDPELHNEPAFQIKSATVAPTKLPSYELNDKNPRIRMTDTKSASSKPKGKVTSKNIHLPSLVDHQVIGRSISAITKKH